MQFRLWFCVGHVQFYNQTIVAENKRNNKIKIFKLRSFRHSNGIFFLFFMVQNMLTFIESKKYTINWKKKVTLDFLKNKKIKSTVILAL